MNEPSTYVLCIGISQYNHIRRLRCANQDAKDMADLLTQNCDSVSHVILLLDAQAHKVAILEKLAWLAQNATVNDTVLLFFTGHGLQQVTDSQTDTYLCPVEASLTAVKQSCIHSDELTVALRAIQVGRLIVFLDTCHAGAIGEPRNLHGHLHVALTEQKLANVIEGSGRVIFGACRPSENAWEINGMRNGLFTHYLLQGLRGGAARGDGTIWMSDLFSYVSRSVRQRQLQVPYQKAIGEDFVILPGVSATYWATMPEQHSVMGVEPSLLRKVMRSAYNRAELALLCADLGLHLEDLTSDHNPLGIQMLHLVDYCNRHGKYGQLVDHILSARPHLSMHLFSVTSLVDSQESSSASIKPR